MTTAEFRQLQADHAEDFRSMAGLVTAIGIAFASLSAIAIWLAIQ